MFAWDCGTRMGAWRHPQFPWEVQPAMRSFVAVEIPPAIRRGLEGLIREVRESDADVKWVRPESVHLTLKFLGEIEPGQVAEIREALAEVLPRHFPFSIRAAGLGCFPKLGQPRVVWVGLSGDEGRLLALQQEVEGALAGLGFPPEGRGFRPHLTLGRVRSPKGRDALISKVRSLMGAELGGFAVRSVVQFRSELLPSGARYTPLWEADLGGRAA